MDSNRKYKLKRDSLYIVMPAYNEEETIENVVRQWYTILDGKNSESRLVVADSCSNDKTHEILMGLQKELNQLEVLSDTLKQHGPKVIALYDYAIKHNADYIFQTDSDGQTNPDEFEVFWNSREEYAAVLGYRNDRGDGKARAFVGQIISLMLKVYFGVKVPDANAPFRLMNTSALKRYLYKLPSDYNIPNVMITTYFAYYNEKILFKTITFKQRQGGVNSINIYQIVKIGIKAIGDFGNLRKEMD
jgi:glycosyltransferase involved in cell wall biosynthesis